MYTETCERSYLPKVIEEFKVKDLNYLRSKWDSLPIPRDKKTKDKYIEVVGSFLPVDYERVILIILNSLRGQLPIQKLVTKLFSKK